MVVVGRNEFTDRHDARRLVLQKVDHFAAELDELRVAHGTLGTQEPGVWKGKPLLRDKGSWGNTAAKKQPARDKCWQIQVLTALH